jgi:hypothetical protein
LLTLDSCIVSTAVCNLTVCKWNIIIYADNKSLTFLNHLFVWVISHRLQRNFSDPGLDRYSGVRQKRSLKISKGSTANFSTPSALQYYTNIPCDCGQYTRIFSRGTLNCMDVLYCPTPTVEGNKTHPCNSRYRGKMFLYIDPSHIEYLLYYILIVK